MSRTRRIALRAIETFIALISTVLTFGVAVAILMPQLLPLDRTWVGIAVLAAVGYNLLVDGCFLVRRVHRDLLAPPVPVAVVLQGRWRDLLDCHGLHVDEPRVLVDLHRGPSAELTYRDEHLVLIVGPDLLIQPARVVRHVLAVQAARLATGAHDIVATARIFSHIANALYVAAAVLIGLGMLTSSNAVGLPLYVAAAAAYAAAVATSTITDHWVTSTYHTATQVAGHLLGEPLTTAIRDHISDLDGWELAWCEPAWSDRAIHREGAEVSS
ncbi:hypothetical protein ABN034_12490 [Actinopolymorpha sp. B11F2]|uniref:hypothetical protein n=1 Tax=Actinopolymorpha sp. B11F2 TaxID=3160862 RepID=UPI0032E4FC4A